MKGNRRKLSTGIERGKRRGRKEPSRTEGTAVRGDREEGKGKSGRLSSQKQAEANERERKAGGKTRKRSESGKEGKHRWNSCGSEAGRDERKQTGSQVPEAGTEAWETRRKRRRKAGKPKGRTEALEKLLRGETRKRGTEETEAE